MVPPAFLLAVPVAGWIAYQSGRALIRRVLDEGLVGIPPWLEALLPLRGRWLHLLLIGPIALAISVAVFLGVLAAVIVR